MMQVGYTSSSNNYLYYGMCRNHLHHKHPSTEPVLYGIGILLITLQFIHRLIVNMQGILVFIFLHRPLQKSMSNHLQSIIELSPRQNNSLLHCLIGVALIVFESPKIVPCTFVPPHSSKLPVMFSFLCISFHALPVAIWIGNMILRVDGAKLHRPEQHCITIDISYHVESPGIIQLYIRFFNLTTPSSWAESTSVL